MNLNTNPQATSRAPARQRVAAPASPAVHIQHLEGPVGRVEEHLEALQGALRADDAQALEMAAGGLQRALAAAVGQFREAARRGGVPGSMRERLALASARVAAQREALARATASLDRAIDVLMPAPAAVYEAAGTAARPRSSGSAQA